MNQFIAKFTRLVMRRMMNWGITKGVGRLSRRGPGAKPASAQHANTHRQAAKRARQAAKLTRRIGR